MSVAEKSRTGETIEKVLRRFKRKVDQAATLKIVKARRYYAKPSDKAREKSKAATKRTKLAARRGY
jgi:small subunit ribosomal protein S21